MTLAKREANEPLGAGEFYTGEKLLEATKVAARKHSTERKTAKDAPGWPINEKALKELISN